MSKHVLSKLALAASIALSTTATSQLAFAETKPVTAYETQTMYTNHGVNARSEANTTSKVIAVIPKDQAIQVIDGFNTAWYRIIYNGQIAYVYSDYVTKKKPTTITPTLPKVIKTAYVKKMDDVLLNVRATPSSAGKKLGTLKEGDAVALTKNYTAKSKDVYFEIIYKNQVGYVASKYITFTKAAETSTAKEVTTKVGIVTNTEGVALKVRKQESTTSTILGTVKEGTSLQLAKAYKKSDKVGWYKVKYKGKTGYVAAQYVTLYFPPAK